jgi:putative membrane protein insertion efficiency factor
MADALRDLPRRAAIVILRAPILGYRLMISPMLPRACRFSPSCSAYALEALASHGPLKGSWLALRRLARCHPFTLLGGGSGYDPVPPHAHKP